MSIFLLSCHVLSTSMNQFVFPLFHGSVPGASPAEVMTPSPAAKGQESPQSAEKGTPPAKIGRAAGKSNLEIALLTPDSKIPAPTPKAANPSRSKPAKCVGGQGLKAKMPGKKLSKPTACKAPLQRLRSKQAANVQCVLNRASTQDQTATPDLKKLGRDEEEEKEKAEKQEKQKKKEEKKEREAQKEKKRREEEERLEEEKEAKERRFKAKRAKFYRSLKSLSLRSISYIYIYTMSRLMECYKSIYAQRTLD